MDLNNSIEKISKGGILGLKGKNIGLIGDLGAGKTYYTKKLLSKFDNNIFNEIQSPTYNYCLQYIINDLEIHHYDLYRVDNENKLEEIGLYESLNDYNILCIVEWIDLYDSLSSSFDLLIEIKRDISTSINFLVNKIV